MLTSFPESEIELEELLSRPTEAAIETCRELQGNILLLGAGGKMGLSLAGMVRRASDLAGGERRVIGVSRFTNKEAAGRLRENDVEAISCDLTDRAAVAELPDAPNVIFMAGQKFGTADAPELTWVANTIVPAIVAERYAQSRIVVFSTGCVYPLVDTDGPGANESHALGGPGEYASSCLGRERIFTHYSKLHATPVTLFRLSYAIDLRYGVLHDVAIKVARGTPIDVTMGYVNLIWQGDANARAIQCLEHASAPPLALNVTGLGAVSIRAMAELFGHLLDKKPRIVGREAPTAWLAEAVRSFELLGPASASLNWMIEATAHWVRAGGASLGKPTNFENRTGHF